MLVEDILDGYFPLRRSVTDLMQRRGLTSATLALRLAPIMDIPGLPHDAPVPLNIREGRAGMILEACLHVTLTDRETDLRGTARWHWLDDGPCGDQLDPMIRLAEPALVSLQPSVGAHRCHAGIKNTA